MVVNNLIIGTARLKFLKGKQRRDLVSLLSSEGDLVFDTAPTYESEDIVGSLQNSNPKIKANTKFSMLVQAAISSEQVSQQLFDSERKLRTIDDYFLHSAQPSLMQPSAWDYLLGAKREGRIKRIGFAGDGEHLAQAHADTRFEVFQSTFSLVDQGNLVTLKAIQEEGRGLQLKRVLGSGTLSRRPLARIRRKFQWPSSDSYQSRLVDIEAYMKLANPLSVRDFVKFAWDVFPKADLVVGISSAKGYREIKSVVGQLNEEHTSVRRALDPSLVQHAWLELYSGTSAEHPVT